MTTLFRFKTLQRFLLGWLAALLLSPIPALAQEDDAEPPPDSSVEALQIPTRYFDVPGARQTDFAPSAATLGSLVYTFLVDRENHILFQTFDPETDRWSMVGSWTEVPGSLLTSASVAVVGTSDRLYVFAVQQSDRQVYVNDKMIGGPLEGWGGWRPLTPGPKAVALAAAAGPDGTLYLFMASEKNKLFFMTDPLLSTAWGLVPGGVTTKLAPGAVYDAATETLYLLARRSNKSEVVLMTLHGGVWSSPCKVPDAGTSTAVTPGISNGQLYVFSISDERIWAQAYGGACGLWTGRAEVRGGGRTNAALALAPLTAPDFPFMLFVKGIKVKRIYYRFFTPEEVVPEVTTRDHFSTSSGKRRKTHTRYDYGIAGTIPGLTPGTSCPEHLAIAVHGWTNPPMDGQDKFLRAQASLRQLGYNGPVVGFSWDSDTQRCPLDFPVIGDAICFITGDKLRGFDEGKEIADGNGPKLAAFLGDFKAHCPCTAIHLMGHSLGARVVLQTLQAFAEDRSLRWSQLGAGRIDDVHLFGAAVNNESPQLNKDFGESIQNEVEKIYNYYSKEDWVLSEPYNYKESSDAVGRSGIENRRQTPTNYTDVDVEDLIKKDHFLYWGKRDEIGAVESTGAMSRVFERFTARSTQCLGWLDPLACAGIEGWVWDKAHPGDAAGARIYVDDTALFQGEASLYRQDLKNEKIGDGKHAFNVPIPLSFKDGQSHTVTASFMAPSSGQPVDTPLELNGSPRTFQCSLEGFLDEAYCGDGFDSPAGLTVRGWAWDPGQPDGRVKVLIQVNGKLLATLTADTLDNTGKGDGYHGFRYTIPPCTGTSNPFSCVATGQTLAVRAGIEGSSFELSQSPVSFFCKQPKAPPPGPPVGF